MAFLDKTFCASPNCKNECGRKMTDKERELLNESLWRNPSSFYGVISQGYFCGEPEDKHDRL